MRAAVRVNKSPDALEIASISDAIHSVRLARKERILNDPVPEKLKANLLLRVVLPHSFVVAVVKEKYRRALCDAKGAQEKRKVEGR